MKITIYGLYSAKTKKCRYIGRTRNIRGRERGHLRNNTIGEPFVFRVIKVVDESEAHLVERAQIIKRRKKLVNKCLPSRLTTDEIISRIKRRESFWVGTHPERVIASRISNILGIKYYAGKDDRGGFYICHLPKVAKRK